MLIDTKVKDIILNFFNTYRGIIDTKLSNGEYELKQRYITIIINDRYDIKFYPYKNGNDDIPTLEVTIVRYYDTTGYARKHNIHNIHALTCNEINDQYNLYSYYEKFNVLYSTLIIPYNPFRSASIFKDINNDIRIQKIDNLLE